MPALDWFAPAFALWGSTTTWLEVAAFALALGMVVCNIRQLHWGWPLAALSSLLYLALFWRDRLYGYAGLQVFFALMALWGWAQWLRGRLADGALLRARRMAPSQLAAAAAATALLWPLLALFLRHFTDSDVPWWDALPSAASIVATVLLGRKFIENWPAWIVINLVSIGLFAHKGLWLTVLLYALLSALAVAGWRAWSATIPRKSIHEDTP